MFAKPLTGGVRSRSSGSTGDLSVKFCSREVRKMKSSMRARPAPAQIRLPAGRGRRKRPLCCAFSLEGVKEGLGREMNAKSAIKKEMGRSGGWSLACRDLCRWSWLFLNSRNNLLLLKQNCHHFEKPNLLNKQNIIFKWGDSVLPSGQGTHWHHPGYIRAEAFRQQTLRLQTNR